MTSPQQESELLRSQLEVAEKLLEYIWELIPSDIEEEATEELLTMINREIAIYFGEDNEI